MSMIKWQINAVNDLLNDPNKTWSADLDSDNDTIKNLTGAATSLSMSDINTKAVTLKNATSPGDDVMNWSEYNIDASDYNFHQNSLIILLVVLLHAL